MKSVLLILALLCCSAFLLACLGSGSKGLEPVWVAPLATAGPPLAANGRVFVWGFPAGHTGDPYRVYALDARTGKELWSVAADHEPSVLTSSTHEFLSIGYEGKSLLLSTKNSLRALDAATGKSHTDQMARQLRFMQQLTIEGNEGYGVNDQKELVCLDIRDGAVRWRVPFLPSEVKPEAAGKSDVFFFENTLLVATPHRKRFDEKKSEFWTLLTAADPANGAVRWRYQPAAIGNLDPSDVSTAAYSSFKSLVVLDQTVLLTLDETTLVKREKGKTWFSMKTLTALELESGKLRWKVAPGGEVLGKNGPDFWLNASTLDFKGEAAHFNAGLDPATGKEKWRRDFSIDGLFQGTRAINTVRETQIDWAKEYTGDRRGSKMRPGWFTSMNVQGSTLKIVDPLTGKTLAATATLDATDMSAPAAWEDMVFVATVAEMKKGRSGVWAFWAPK